MNDKIIKIYEVIADKTLSFGCVLKDPAEQKAIIKTSGKLGFDVLYISGCDGIIDMKRLAEGKIHNDCGYKIIGHPVMIGDVLDWYSKLHPVEMYIDHKISGPEFIYSDVNWVNINSMWQYLRKPIEEQSPECIDFIFSLIPPGN